MSSADAAPVVQASGPGFVADPGTTQSVGELPVLTARLDQLAKGLGVVIYGISGYRTPAHSVAVGGFADDPHTNGQAEDIGVNSLLRSSAARIREAQLRRYGLHRPFDPSDGPPNRGQSHPADPVRRPTVARGVDSRVRPGSESSLGAAQPLMAESVSGSVCVVGEVAAGGRLGSCVGERQLRAWEAARAAAASSRTDLWPILQLFPSLSTTGPWRSRRIAAPTPFVAAVDVRRYTSPDVPRRTTPLRQGGSSLTRTQSGRVHHGCPCAHHRGAVLGRRRQHPRRGLPLRLSGRLADPLHQRPHRAALWLPRGRFRRQRRPHLRLHHPP